MATKEQYRMIVERRGWYYSAAHGGWINDREKRDGGYVVRDDPEDICAGFDIDVNAELQQMMDQDES